MTNRKIFFILFIAMSFMLTSVATSFAKEVVLYSSNQPELLDTIAQGFKKKTGIKLTTVRIGTGEAMKRINAEKNNPLGDVFWSGDVAVLDNAKENFTPYDSPEAKVLPEAYVEKNKLWTASNTHLMIIMVNTDLVAEKDIPTKWADLFDPKWKDKVVIANPQKSGTAYAQAYGFYKMFGDDGLNRLVENAKILDSSSLVYKGTAEGEFHAGITMEYAAYRYIAGGAKNIKIVYPADGVISSPEGAAVIANAKHMNEAKLLVDYLLSKEVETEIFKTYYRRPARPDTEKVGDLPAINEITLMKGYDIGEANRLQPEILKKWRKLVLYKK